MKLTNMVLISSYAIARHIILMCATGIEASDGLTTAPEKNQARLMCNFAGSGTGVSTAYSIVTPATCLATSPRRLEPHRRALARPS